MSVPPASSRYRPSVSTSLARGPRRPGVGSGRRGPSVSPWLWFCTLALVWLGAVWPHAATATPAQAGLCSALRAMIDADARGDTATVQRLATNDEAVWRGDLLELQVWMRPGVATTALTDDALRQLGGAAGVRATTVMNVWLPLDQVDRLVRDHAAQVAFVQLPWRPHLLADGDPKGVAGGGAGEVLSQGRAKIIASPEELACVGNTGAGVKVAVIDGGFEKLDKAIAQGEAPHTEGTYPLSGGTHGTMCVEVVADMAPGATIRPISANSYAVLQQFQAEMKMGNPNKIDIVSHSVIWLGMSFGRHEGLACQVTDATRAQGVAWVNASGNSGKGQFHMGRWRDQDEDKKHDFEQGDPTLRFKQNWGGGTIKLTLDWDDYKSRKVDLDLYLFQLTKDGFLKQVGQSNKKQGPYTAPVEQIILQKPGSAVFAAVVLAKTPVPKGMGFRLINLGSGASSFSVWHKNGNVYDPASCKGVLTVGAIHHSRYDKGPQEGYSSFGPTPDGRLKPEVMAPTSVSTSVGNFGGTSCACPHAAGALALYKAVTTVSADAVVQSLINDAEPMGIADPNHTFGHGRVVVRTQGSGWQCASEDTASAACTTPCGSTGTTACASTCTWEPCVAPDETCNGADDDCDGVTDEGCDEPDVDAGSLDASADVTDGAEADAATDTAASDVAVTGGGAGDEGGCTAAPRGRASGLLWAALAAVLTLWIRRRAHGAERAA